MADYALTKTLDIGYEDALSRATDELKKEGFGILTEIDVKSTLKQKIDADFRKYKILGACNPPLAQRALTAELEIGVMLPCNVCVWEGDDGKAVVSAFDPEKMFPKDAKPELRELAKEVRGRLVRVLEAL